MAAELRPVRTVLAGEPDQVANVLRAAEARGHLVDVHGSPQSLTDRRVSVDVTLLCPVPTPFTAPRPAESPVQPWYRRPLVWVRVTAVTAALGVLGGLAWVVYAVVVWVAAHLAVVIGLTVAVLVLLGLAARVALGSGDHCPGCRG